jgi:hypothetical protein
MENIQKVNHCICNVSVTYLNIFYNLYLTIQIYSLAMFAWLKFHKKQYSW